MIIDNESGDNLFYIRKYHHFHRNLEGREQILLCSTELLKWEVKGRLEWSSGVSSKFSKRREGIDLFWGVFLRSSPPLASPYLMSFQLLVWNIWLQGLQELWARAVGFALFPFPHYLIHSFLRFLSSSISLPIKIPCHLDKQLSNSLEAFFFHLVCLLGTVGSCYPSPPSWINPPVDLLSQ